MDDFSNIINLLESAKQLASMNGMPVLAYLIDVAKCEARTSRFCASANAANRPPRKTVNCRRAEPTDNADWPNLQDDVIIKQ